jgi:hypothetical protein
VTVLLETYLLRRLPAAILKRAVRDAISANGHSATACCWLVSDDADLLLSALAIDGDAVAAWLETLEPVKQCALPGL